MSRQTRLIVNPFKICLPFNPDPPLISSTPFFTRVQKIRINEVKVEVIIVPRARSFRTQGVLFSTLHGLCCYQFITGNIPLL